MAAGRYPDRLEWLKRTPGGPDGFGQRADAYPSQGTLWGSVDDRQGGRGSAKESDRAEVRAVIRLRNCPGVVAGDRLRLAGLAEVWTVEHTARGVNELVCEATRPRWSAGGGAAV